MTLATSTPLLSQGTATAYQATLAIVSLSPRTRYTDAEVRELVTLVIRWCALFGFNHDIVLAQIAHETNWLRFTGDVAFGQHNYAGLGATGGVPGHSFPSIEAGVLAVVAHHAVYRWGPKQTWPAYLQQYAGEHVDPRYDDVLSTGNDGKMIVLGDYRGTWAVPGTTYPERLIERAQQIAAFPAEDPYMSITVPGLPYRVQHITTKPGTGNRPGMFNPAEWITVHTTGNQSPTAGALMHRNFVQNGGGIEGVSFQQSVDAIEAVEILPRTEAGWHAGDGYNGPGNRRSLGIETCENADWQMTFIRLGRLVAWDVRTGAAGVAAILKAHGAVAAMSRVVQHNHWSGKDCPRPIRRAGSWPMLLADARGIVDQVVTPVPDVVTIPGVGTFPRTEVRSFPDRVGFHIVMGFRAFWEELEARGRATNWREAGYPLSNEFQMRADDGTILSVQEFERCALIYDPRHAGTDWAITFANFPQRYAIRRALGYPVHDLVADLSPVAA